MMIKKNTLIVSIVLGALMVSSAALTKVITPTTQLAASRPAVDLNSLVPPKIGEWQEDKNLVAAVVNPQTEAALNKIYAQTLSRTYVNANGERIMLSIAYGRDQGGEDTQVHRPEFCYAAQGFNLVSNVEGALATVFGNIPVRRLVAVQGRRIEPITYWITVGDKATLPGFGRKLAQLQYGLNGTVPDGLLFRVSSIQKNESQAYKSQEQFVNALFSTIDASQRVRLAGNLVD